MVVTILSPKTLTALAFAALIPVAGLAQTPAPATTPSEPDWTFTGNVGLFSQYVFRGISQTNEKPAVQGGFDLGHKSGFYAGTWASNVSWIADGYFSPPNPPPPPSASMEWDFYGGYKGSLPMDFGYDLGVLYYYYPGSYPTGFTKPNTTELYAALSWKWLSFKYSYSADNKTFGIPNSRGSYYLDLTASYDIVEKVSDSTEVLGVTVGIYGTGTNAEDAAYTNIYGKNIAGNQFVGYVQKTF